MIVQLPRSTVRVYIAACYGAAPEAADNDNVDSSVRPHITDAQVHEAIWAVRRELRAVTD